MVPVLDLAPPQRASEARRILNERVLPKRELVVRIAQAVQAGAMGYLLAEVVLYAVRRGVIS